MNRNRIPHQAFKCRLKWKKNSGRPSWMWKDQLHLERERQARELNSNCSDNTRPTKQSILATIASFVIFCYVFSNMVLFHLRHFQFAEMWRQFMITRVNNASSLISLINEKWKGKKMTRYGIPLMPSFTVIGQFV